MVISVLPGSATAVRPVRCRRRCKLDFEMQPATDQRNHEGQPQHTRYEHVSIYKVTQKSLKNSKAR